MSKHSVERTGRMALQPIWASLLCVIAVLAICCFLGVADGLAQTIPPPLDPAVREDLIKRTIGHAPNLDRILWYFFKIVLMGIAIALLVRTALAKSNARFVKHLAVAYSIILIAGVGEIVKAFITDRLALEALSMASGNVTTAAFDKIDAHWDGIKIALSFFSTFWFFLAASLIYYYPQGIPRDLFGAVTGIAGLIIALIQVAQVQGPDAIRLLEIIDSVSSTVAAVLVGWALLRLSATNQKTKTLQFATMLAYVGWGLAQLLYWMFPENSYYLGFLFFAGYASMIMTVVLCSIMLDDKPEFAADAVNVTKARVA